MGMNLMKMMQQVQNVQKKASAMQEELANLDIVGESAGGAIKVTCDGQGKFKSIKIDLNLPWPSQVTFIVISAAMKEATVKASKEMEERMKKITGGIKIPGLSF